MVKEINHRYLKDKHGNEFFPITHIDAIQGLDIEELQNSDEVDIKIEQKISEVNNKIETANKTIENANKTIESQQKAIKNMNNTLFNVTGDTGWIDYQVHPNNKKNVLSSAPDCAIREIRVGNDSVDKTLVFRSIRINIGNINHNTTIAQLPIGFNKDTVSFVLRSSGGKTPVELSIEKDSSVKAFLANGESNVWAAGQFTWLV